MFQGIKVNNEMVVVMVKKGVFDQSGDVRIFGGAARHAQPRRWGKVKQEPRSATIGSTLLGPMELSSPSVQGIALARY
jgi:hypothetical protein